MAGENDNADMVPVGEAAVKAMEAATGERIWDGRPIRETGIYAGIPIQTYHGDTKLFIGAFDGFSISSSGLRSFVDRPSAYWATSPFNPKRYDREEQDYFTFGRAAHHLLLGERGFAEEFVLRPEKMFDEKLGKDTPWNANRTVCKEWLAAQEKTGKSVITEDQLERIKWIADSMERHPLVRAGILSGKVERSIMVDMGQFWLRSRPDNLPVSSGDIVDLKTAQDVSDDGISRAIGTSGYHIQAAVARIAYEKVFGPGSFNSFSFVFVEKQPPFDVRVVQLKDADIERGMKQLSIAFKSLERCLSTGEWPGYDGANPEARYAEMSAWAQRQIDQALLIGEAA